MIHRYAFEGAGAQALDSIGAAHGEVMGTALNSSGSVELSGLDDADSTDNMADWVALPPGLISSLSGATFELWFEWHGGNQWQRLLDFGSTDINGNPDSYLFVTVQSYAGLGQVDDLAAVLSYGGGSLNEIFIHSRATIAPTVYSHVALSVDDAGNRMTFYVDGALASSQSVDVRLDAINDEVCMLGRSLYDVDPYFGGTIDEFRIYNRPLTGAEIAWSYAQGSDWDPAKN